MLIEYRKTTASPKQIFPEYRYHFHPDYEVYYFVSGDASYLVEGREYQLTPHSMMLLAPNVLHSVRVNSDVDYVRNLLSFSLEDILPERRGILLSAFPNSPSRSDQAVFYENLKEYDFESLLRKIQSAENLPEELRLKMSPIFLEAFLAQAHIMFQRSHPSATSSTAPPVILAVIEYLNGHIAEPHTLDSLAERFLINKDYMNRGFKKATGTTIIDYLLFKRVVLAKEYIANGEGAANAALAVGFSNYSSFYRAYKRILKETPSAVKPSSVP